MAAYLIATLTTASAQRPARGDVRARAGDAAWLSSKYGLMMAALATLALGRVWLPIAGDPTRGPAAPAADQGAATNNPPVPLPQRIRVSLALGLPMVVSVALWMGFFYWIWGSPLPSAVYGTQRPVRWEYLVKGGPGLLFDQEYGIVPVAPIFAASFVGLLVMLAADARARRSPGSAVVSWPC